MDATYHIPALLNETIVGLNIQPQGVYVDLTFGGGGHSRAILRELHRQNELVHQEGGMLYSFDQDIDAYENQRQAVDSLIEQPNWQFVHGNFRYLSQFMDYYGVRQVHGILADLGVSFHHFDSAERGFSFRFPGPLDMRMNQSGRKTAQQVINNYSEEELARIFYLYGELPNARQLARWIVQNRTIAPILRTEQLVASVLHQSPAIQEGELCIPPKAKKDLARLFQALRIEVNDEMAALEQMLLSTTSLLYPGGRIAILTYHSLEDRMVKNFFRSGNLEGTIHKDFYGNPLTPFRLLEKGLVPSSEEMLNNPRSRSAKLRVVEYIGEIE